MVIRPDGRKKAFVRLEADVDALDVANKVSSLLSFLLNLRRLIVAPEYFRLDWFHLKRSRSYLLLEFELAFSVTISFVFSVSTQWSATAECRVDER